MANFRIDTLILELQGNGTYTLTGECNSDAGNPATSVIGVYDEANKEIVFDTLTGSPNAKYSFFCDAISFSNYNAFDMAKIFFGNTTDPLARRKKGGIVVGDSSCPPPAPHGGVVVIPPSTGHETFSAQFKLSKITSTRDLATNNSSVSLELFCPAGPKTYTFVSAQFLVDPALAPLQIIGVELHETSVASPASTLSFLVDAPTGIALAGFDPNGLAIIVKEDTRPYSDVNTKKGMFYID
jgi:hypothetical protein